MWEQTVQTAQQAPIQQRSSLPSHQRQGARTSTPPVSGQQSRNTRDDDALYSTRMPSSARRYQPPGEPSERRSFVDTEGNQVIEQGNQRLVIHNEPPPQRKIHWLLILGIGMILMLGLYLGLSWLGNWWTNHQLDAAYGYPRTYQTDAVVGHDDSAANPSHFIFLNLNGHVEIIEMPGGDASKAKIYIGPTLYSDDAPLIPVTGEFRNVNGTVEMIVHIQNQEIIYVSDGTKFVPK